MKRLIVSLCCCLVAVTLLVHAEDTNQNAIQLNSESDPRFDARISDLIAKNVLQLSQEIGTAILQDSDKSAEVISPLSIYTALSILLMGSNGQTFNELMNLLKINNDSYLSQNTWKVHEEFSLMIEDINRDIPHPGRRRQQTSWLMQAPLVTRRNKTIHHDQEIIIANGMFYQNGFSIRPDFRSAVENAYRSTLQRLDFENKPHLSTDYINRWISEKTKGKINDMISAPLSRSTRSVFASTLYFKAFWERTFAHMFTRRQEFYPDGTNRPSITVDMMLNDGNFPFYDSKEYDCKIIGFPYRKRLTTMYIIIPNNSTRSRLRQFQATLTADKIDELIAKMKWTKSMIYFPKFHITNKVDMRTILNRMGLRLIFKRDQSDLSLISTGVESINSTDQPNISTNSISEALKRDRRSAVTYKAISKDFHTILSRGRRETPFDSSVSLKRLDLLRSRLISEHASNPGLFADELIHQIDLTVNEYGTEGAAATVTSTNRAPSIEFRADTPFLFLIRHESTKLPIFYGAVFEPTN